MPSNSQLMTAVDEADVIFHFGAGKCRELSLYLSGPAGKSIVLVEANPRTANFLAAQCANHSNVTVVPCALAREPGEHTLYVYNLWELSSLRVPTGLYDLFPGLRIVRELSVEAVAPAQVLSEFGVQDCQSPLLVVDVPGEELSILQSLRDEEYLGSFRCLLVRCGAGGLYEGAESSDAVLTFLQDQGYDQLATWDDEDPDRPCWLFRASALRKENRELKFRLKELEEDLKDKQRAYEVELETIKQQEADLAKKAAAEKAGLEDRARSDQAELEQAKRDLIEATNRIRRLEADLEASTQQVQMLTSECAAQEKALVSAYTQLDVVESDRESLGAAASVAEEGATDLKRERDNLAEDVEALRQSLQEAKGDLSVALRLQVLRENDLKDLQSRYSQILSMKERQDDLLAKLRSRLGVASEYLQQLTLKGTHSVDDGLARDFVRSLVGKDE